MNRKISLIILFLILTGLQLSALDNNIIVENIIPTPGDLVIAENDSINFVFSGYDPDLNELSYSWKLNTLIVGADSTYVFLTDYNSAGNYILELLVSDSTITRNDTVFTWNIEVTDIDQPIIVNQLNPTIGVIDIAEGDSIDFEISAYDPDGNVLTYSWELDNILQSNADTYTYISDFQSAGTHVIEMRVSDLRNFYDFVWTINVADVDQPIEVGSISPVPGRIVAKENDDLLLEISALDPDGNVLSYQWFLDEISVSDTAQYLFNPGLNSVGTYQLILEVLDGVRDSLQYQWDITVERSTKWEVPEDFTTIQAAVDYSVTGDTILVNTGTYNENITIDKDINITSYYQQERSEGIIDSTIIDGNLFGRVITYSNGVTTASKLSGFTIKRGSAANGAGISITNGNSPSISHCIIEDHAGFGIYINGSSPLIEFSKIQQCYGTGIKVDGQNTSNIILDGVTVSGNNGKGIEAQYAIIDVINCLIKENSTTMNGGGISAFASHIDIINSTITANSASAGGGLYFDTACNVTIINSILAGNSPENIYFNTVNYPCAASISYSDILNDYDDLVANSNLNLISGAGNVDIDPWFNDISQSDYSLHKYSPLIGAGNINGAPDHDLLNAPRPNPVGSNPDLGAFENTLASAADQIIVINSLIPTPGDYSITELDSLDFICSAYDPDGNDLEYNWSLDDLSASIDSTYTYLTTYSSAGSHIIELNLTDNFGSRNDTTFIWNIEVSDLDQQIITNYIYPEETNLTIAELDSISFVFSGYDPDGNDLLYNWIVDSVAVSTDSSFIFNTDYQSAGSYDVSLNVEDGFVGSMRDQVEFSWVVEVTETDQNLIISDLSPLADTLFIREIDSLEFLCSAIDPDGNQVEYLWLLDSAQVSVDTAFVYVADFNSAGLHQLDLNLTDNFSRNDTTITWYIYVEDVDQNIVVNYILPDSGSISIVEGESETFICSAFDPDGNSLEYQWILDSLIVSSDSQYVYSPDYFQAGQHQLDLFVTDNFGSMITRNSIYHNWMIDVIDIDQGIHTNDIVPTPGVVSITETDSLEFIFDGYDPDGNELEFIWKVDDIMVSTDSSFIFYSDYSSAGDYFVTLDVTDNYGVRDDQLFIWYVEILDVDRPVLINWTVPALGSITINETDSVNFAVSATDPDSNLITYQWKIDSLVVSTDSSYTFITDFSSAGDYSILCNISDGFTTRNDTTLFWNLSVINIDQPIVVDSLYPAEGSLTANEGDILNFWFDGYDPDGNQLIFDWKLNGSTVSNLSNLIYTLDFNSAGIHTISLDIDDGFRSRDQLHYDWELTILDVDQPIVVNFLTPNPGLLQISETDEINFHISAFDPDGNDVVFHWILDSLLVSTDSLYNFVSDFNSSGHYSLDLEINDNYSRDIQIFSWDINILESDQGIIVNNIEPLPGMITIAESDSVNFQFSGYDPDGADLDFKWFFDGVISGQDSIFTLLTDFNSAGTHSVALQVTDNFGIIRSDTSFVWQINIINVDQPIIVGFIDPLPGEITINELETVTFAVNASDPDGNLVSFYWQLDSLMVGSDSTFTYISDYESAGLHLLQLMISDGFTTRNDTTFSWSINVNDIDRDIVISNLSPSPGELNLIESESVTFNCSAYDPDGNDLSFNWELDTTTVGQDSVLTYISDYNSSGLHSLTLTISDNYTRDDTLLTWVLDITDVDQDIIGSVEPESGLINIIETDAINFSFNGYDPDGDSLDYLWYLDNNLVSEAYDFLYQTDYNSAGTHFVTLTVSDGYEELLRSELSYSWQVIVAQLDQQIVIENISPADQNVELLEGGNQEFSIFAYDPDGQTLLYSWQLDNQPVSNDSSYLYSPDYESAGEHQLDLLVADGWSRNDTIVTWFIIVNDVDQNIIGEVEPESGLVNLNEGDQQQFSFSGVDPDGNQLEYLWMLDETAVGSESNYTYSANFQAAGTHLLSLTIEDNYRSQLIYNWTLEVADIDQDIIGSVEPESGLIEITETESITFNFNGYDPDGNDLDYQWILDSEVVGQDSSYSYVAGYSDAGDHEIQLNVNDGFNRNIVQFNWQIEVGNITVVNVPDDFETIQSAINAVGNGDTILVASGVYPEILTIQNKTITLASYYLITGDRDYIDNTIIDGQQNNSVVNLSGVPETARLSGFTIENGFSFFGAGVKCNSGSDLQIDHLKIRNNAAAYGGGLYIHNSSPKLLALEIDNNEGSISGGGIYLESSSALLENLLIYENNSGDGAAIRMLNSTAILTNLTISDNSSPNMGIISLADSYPELHSCIISHNNGIGISSDNSLPTVEFSNFYENSSGNFLDCASELEIITETNINGDPCDEFSNIYFTTNFQNREADDYHLNQYALNIGAGDPTSNLTYDFEDNNRPVPSDSNIDIGCFESEMDRAEDGEIVLTSVYPSPGIVNIMESDSVMFQVAGYDINGRDIDYVWFKDGSVVSNNSSYNFQTEPGMAGDYQITLFFDDDWLDREFTRFDSTLVWNVNVAELDQLIVVESIEPEPGNIIISENENIQFVCDAFDPDGNLLNYAWILDAVEVSTDSSYSFETDFSSAGDYLMTLYLTDETMRHDTLFVWNITVEESDQFIVVENLEPAEGEIILNEGDYLEFAIDAYDPDGNVLLYNWILDTVHVGNDSLYFFDTDFNSAGNHLLILQVSDEFSRNDTTFTWDINVNNVDQYPIITEFSPEDTLLTADGGDVLEFYLVAYDPDSDELEFQWYIDDQLISNDSLFIHTLNLIGNYEIKGVVSAQGLAEYQLWQVEITTDSEDTTVPLLTSMLQNYPNPFSLYSTDRSSYTTFELSIGLDEDNIDLVIYNLKGQKIRRFKIDNPTRAKERITWDGCDERGEKVTPGIYFYQLLTSKKSIIKRMVIIK